MTESTMNIFEATLVTDAHTFAALLTESNDRDLFSVQCQVEHWLRLIEREEIRRFRALALQGAA